MKSGVQSDPMASGTSHHVKTNTPVVVKRIFVLVVVLCIFQQLNVLSTYSKRSLLLLESDDATLRPFNKEKLISINDKGNMTMEKIENPTDGKEFRNTAAPTTLTEDDNKSDSPNNQILKSTKTLDESAHELADQSSNMEVNVPTTLEVQVEHREESDQVQLVTTLSDPKQLVTTLDVPETKSNRTREKRRENIESEEKDDIERAMFVISMGEKAANTKTVERFVYSARKIGKYDGWIVVVTDAPPDRYEGLDKWTSKVIIMAPKEEDVKNHYRISNMKYKRFKTMAIEYMDRDPRLDRVELIYYLDVDIVFGDTMMKAFHGLESTYGIGRLGANSRNTTSLGRGKMWMFKGNAEKWHIQGGQIILDRTLSQPCLERWRKGFDQEETMKLKKDQWLLMDIKAEMDEAMNATLKNNTELECEIVIMEQAPYIEFPLVLEIKRRSQKLAKNPNYHYAYSPMVHVRNDGGTASMKSKNIRPYMKHLLRFKKNQKDRLGILQKVKMDTT